VGAEPSASVSQRPSAAHRCDFAPGWTKKTSPDLLYPANAPERLLKLRSLPLPLPNENPVDETFSGLNLC
jgi:hypothetical protein